MVKVTILGLLNVNNEPFYVEAKDVEELIEKICEKMDNMTKERLTSCVIIVNQKYIDLSLDYLKTKLSDGDEVIFLRPISGG